MRNKFITKSVRTATLGEKLKEVRDEKRISLAEASRATRIQVKYLEKLEEGKFSELPADVYVKGFLRSYAAYLGISDLALIKAYDREKEIQKNIKKKDLKETFNRPIDISTFAVTPKHLVVALSAILVFLGFFYIYREANLFISTPRLVVAEPMDGAEIGERSVSVSGMAERDAEVTINDQIVIVDDEGNFRADIGIQRGVNAITVKATNRFEKEAAKTIQVNGTFEEEPVAEMQNQENTGQAKEQLAVLGIEIFVDPGPVWLSIEADGSLVFSGIMEAKDKKTFEAKEKIVISSAKGNNTYLRIGGGEEQLLSTDPGMVKGIEFLAE